MSGRVKFERPARGNVRAQYDANGCADLPYDPERQARAQKIPVFGRFTLDIIIRSGRSGSYIVGLAIVDDRDGVSFVGQHIGQQHFPAPGQLLHVGRNRRAVEGVTQIQQAGGKNDDAYGNSGADKLNRHKLGRTGEDNQRHGLRCYYG